LVQRCSDGLVHAAFGRIKILLQQVHNLSIAETSSLVIGLSLANEVSISNGWQSNGITIPAVSLSLKRLDEMESIGSRICGMSIGSAASSSCGSFGSYLLRFRRRIS